jgi:predicted DNA-binding ribbon-helix-helix protein
MKSLVHKRSVVIAGHKTSISIEDAFWREVRKIAERDKRTIGEVVAAIDTNRKHGNLSSAIRLAVLSNLQKQIVNLKHPPGGGAVAQHAGHP